MSFEKQYYESDSFWKEGMLSDESNMLRFKTTIDMIPENVSSLIDVGCGNGLFVSILSQEKKISRIIGLDRSEAALKYVKTEKAIGDIVDLPFDDFEFDCVSALEIIEHLPVGIFEKALSELCRISKKYILLSVPYNEKLENSYTKCPQCSSIFNKELHLRKFSMDYFKNLLKEYRFENVKTTLEGKTSKYYGHDAYVSIFYPKQNKLKWDSPICPICGYSSNSLEGNTQQKINKSDIENKTNSILPVLKKLPKIIWPQKTSYYWIIGLFKKTYL